MRIYTVQEFSSWLCKKFPLCNDLQPLMTSNNATCSSENMGSLLILPTLNITAHDKHYVHWIHDVLLILPDGPKLPLSLPQLTGLQS